MSRRKQEQVCPKCWRASCRGDCETPAERAARERREQVAQVAARERRERGGSR